MPEGRQLQMMTEHLNSKLTQKEFWIDSVKFRENHRSKQGFSLKLPAHLQKVEFRGKEMLFHTSEGYLLFQALGQGSYFVMDDMKIIDEFPTNKLFNIIFFEKPGDDLKRVLVLNDTVMFQNQVQFKTLENPEWSLHKGPCIIQEIQEVQINIENHLKELKGRSISAVFFDSKFFHGAGALMISEVLHRFFLKYKVTPWDSFEYAMKIISLPKLCQAFVTFCEEDKGLSFAWRPHIWNRQVYHDRSSARAYLQVWRKKTYYGKEVYAYAFRNFGDSISKTVYTTAIPGILPEKTATSADPTPESQFPTILYLETWWRIKNIPLTINMVGSGNVDWVTGAEQKKFPPFELKTVQNSSEKGPRKRKSKSLKARRAKYLKDFRCGNKY